MVFFAFLDPLRQARLRFGYVPDVIVMRMTMYNDRLRMVGQQAEDGLPYTQVAEFNSMKFSSDYLESDFYSSLTADVRHELICAFYAVIALRPNFPKLLIGNLSSIHFEFSICKSPSPITKYHCHYRKEHS